MNLPIFITAVSRRSHTLTISRGLKRYLLIGLSSLALLLLVLQAHAQVQTNSAPPGGGGGGTEPPGTPDPISGPAAVQQGQSYTYTITGGTGATGYAWQLTPSNAGTISGPFGVVQILWSPTFTGTAVLDCAAVNSYGSTHGGPLNVTVYAPLGSGSISPGSQAINYNTAASILTASSATGGDGAYSYKWQSSADNSTWTDIAGANGLSCSPGTLTATTYYHLVTNDVGNVVVTGTATVTVYPQVAPGSITTTPQTINYGANAATLTSISLPSGGNGSYSYVWQSSPDNSTWSNIGTATASSYQPTGVLATTYYRRSANSNGVIAYSGSVKVTVYPQLTAGTISPASQAINYNTAATLPGTAATGGNGTYTYQWQSSPNNSTWTNISGATSTGYSSGTLTATTYFRRTASSNGVSVNSSVATVTVYPQLAAGTISPASQSINYNTAAATLTGTAATGGNGTYTYQWQSSPDNSTWTNVAGATGLSYTPGTLTATTYFRRTATSNGVSITGATATVTVYAQLAAGTISPASQSINYNTAAATLTGTVATGGNSTYTYQWQSSPNNSTWTNVAGATGLSYAPGTLAATTYYHRVAVSNGVSVTGATATVTVYPQLAAGTTSPASQSINYNATAATLTGTAATGGNGTYTYQWQSSPNNSTWTNVAGATSLSYAPGARMATTYFHLVSTSNGVSVTGATATATVYPQLTAGTVSPASQSINYNTAAATLTGTAATGGNGSYTYQWQSSPNNSTWTNVAGATSLSYAPGIRTTTTYFHLVSASNGVSVTGATATVTVYPQLAAGAVNPAAQTVLVNTAPAVLSCAPSGGSGTYSYQWQSSPDNSVWTNISSAIGNSYSPGTLTVNTYCRVSVTSNGINAYTAAASINVTSCPVLNTNPGTNMNYVLTSTFRIPGITSISSPAQLAAMTTCDLNQVIQYVDGLGRPLQTVQVKGSPMNRDIVQPVAYDPFGRAAQRYLPYVATPATSNGSYKGTAITDQSSFYTNPSGGTWNAPGVVTIPAISGISPAYSMPVFEPSPLNRVVEQGAPGADWQPVAGSTAGHTAKIGYTFNNALTDTASSRVAALYMVTINTDQTRTLTRATGANYTAGQLTVTVGMDENWKSGRGGTVEEYKDKEGHVVLKRAFNYMPGSPAVLQILSTYYVYDDLGNLAFVLPPKSNADNVLPVQATLDNLCYQYRYDDRGRLTQKKLPGENRAWEYMVYNKLDQVVLSQDGRQRTSNQWSVNKYDAQGRIIMTGLWNAGSAISQATLQTNIYAGAQWDIRNPADATTGYTVSSYPALSSILTINYYDDYYNIPGLPTQYSAPAGANPAPTGLPAASKTTILGTTNMLWDVNYYDNLGRVIQSYKQHNLGGGTPNAANYDVVINGYDFTNAYTATTRKHYISTNTSTPAVTIGNTYTYDHMGRKINSYEQINGGTNVLLSQAEYNEISQLKTKHLHSETGSAPFLQDIDYTYNERGWLKTEGNTSNLFSLELRYISSTDAISKQYNGNIAEMLYKGQLSGSKTFIYSYDQLNRLGKATSNDNLLNEQLTYDLQGNIMSLVRTGNSSASLAYTYQSSNQSNQLQTVLNSGSAFRNYAYDANGNATSDGTNKTIAYNLLDLPQTVTQGATTLATYTYDAAGQKLRNTGSDGSWDYISGIVYNNNAISFIQTEEGRAIPNGGNYHYEYNLTDLLGNVRVSFDKNPTDNTVRTLQEDEYYAFGLRSLKQDNSSHNRYLYNGKEIQIDLTNQYDYGARFYDPVIARWATPDPLAEINRRWSPYNYVENNPIRFTDPDGMDVYNPNADLPKGDGQDQMDQQTADAEKRSALIASVNRALSGNVGGPPGKKGGSRTTAKADATRMASKIPAIQPKLKVNDGLAHLNIPQHGQGTISSYPPPEEVNYQDFGLRTTSLAIGNNVLDTYGTVAGAAELKTLFWGAEVAINGETAATKLGRAMHSIYKSGEVDGINTFKEFTGVKGIRPDFVDFGTKTIYELKPNNARALQQGLNQLNNYKTLFEQQYGGTWKIVLDHY
jgi:RHS repeat-associated protein